MKVVEFLTTKLKDLERQKERFIHEKYSFNNSGYQEEMDAINDEISQYKYSIEELTKIQETLNKVNG